ncbi:unnamed protein product, partial [Symbiodinium sp. KB8]
AQEYVRGALQELVHLNGSAALNQHQSPLGTVSNATINVLLRDSDGIAQLSGSIALSFYLLALILRLVVYMPHIYRMVAALQRLKNRALLAVAALPLKKVLECRATAMQLMQTRASSEDMEGADSSVQLQLLAMLYAGDEVEEDGTGTPGSGPPTAKAAAQLAKPHVRRRTMHRLHSSGGGDSPTPYAREAARIRRARLATTSHFSSGSLRGLAAEVRATIDSSSFTCRALAIGMFPSVALVVLYTAMLLQHNSVIIAQRQAATDMLAANH